ncbi:MAG: hypothetical protein K8S18_14145, partial [Desulfobacula sp.]|nr:hypothetical protein [Desulfobacula sp.]
MKQNLRQKVLWDGDIQRQLKEFQPDILFLFPTNLQSLFRFHLKYHILKYIGINSKIVLFSFQPMHHNRIMEALLKFGLPDFIFTQSTKESGHFRKLGVESCPIPSGVDTDKFIPTSIEQKAVIKRKYGMSSDRFVISHVGHLSPNRNLDILVHLKRELPQGEVILVVPPSGNVRHEIEKHLKASGVTIIQKHIDNIEEIYQMS